MTEFAGYEMPLWYTTTTDEHLAVRNGSGIFDVSHMGRFMIRGGLAASFLEGLVPTQVQKQSVGRAFYTLLLNDQAGIIDDLVILRLGETEFMVVVNAANARTDIDHIRSSGPPGGVEIEDLTNKKAGAAAGGKGAASKQVPDPGLIGGVREFEQLGKEALELVAQPVGGAAELLAEFVFQAGQFAQSNHGGGVELDLAEAVAVGAQRVGEHEGVAAVVLGAGR